VDQFVSEHVIRFAETGGKRQDDASFLVLSDAADAVAEPVRNDIGLRELRVARVQHDRLTLGEGVIEAPREAVVPALGQPAGLHHGFAIRGVVIDVEVRRLENPENRNSRSAPCCARTTAHGSAPPTQESRAHRPRRA
jgi:hypothetical protein